MSTPKCFYQSKVVKFLKAEGIKVFIPHYTILFSSTFVKKDMQVVKLIVTIRDKYTKYQRFGKKELYTNDQAYIRD